MSGPVADLSLPPDDATLIERIRSFVADALDKPVEEVGTDDHLYSQLGLDSLGAVAVFVDLTYELGVPEPSRDANLSEYYTVRLLAHYARSFELRAHDSI